MKRNASAWVYFLTNYTRHSLYIGVTTDLERRIAEHKSHLVPGYTQKYQVGRLVYYEEFQSIREALEREKYLKGWTRARKNALVDAFNPEWRDLAEG